MPEPPRPSRTRLEKFLDSWEQDEADQVTIRSLHQRLDKHEREDNDRFDNIREKLGAVGERAAKTEGRMEARTTNPDILVVKTAAEERQRARRESLSPLARGIAKTLDLTLVKVILLAAAALIGAFAHYLTDWATRH